MRQEQSGGTTLAFDPPSLRRRLGIYYGLSVGSILLLLLKLELHLSVCWNLRHGGFTGGFGPSVFYFGEQLLFGELWGRAKTKTKTRTNNEHFWVIGFSFLDHVDTR